MIALRPMLVPGEAPLALTRAPRPLLDASVRPLCRSLALAAALALPAFGPLAASLIPGGGWPEAQRTAAALRLSPGGGAAVRPTLREAAR